MSTYFATEGVPYSMNCKRHCTFSKIIKGVEFLVTNYTRFVNDRLNYNYWQTSRNHLSAGMGNVLTVLRLIQLIIITTISAGEIKIYVRNYWPLSFFTCTVSPPVLS